MWFSDWNKVGQMLLIALICYVALVIMLRLSGKRSLAKMNMFDFVVTVATGSMLANVALGGTPLVDGLLGLALLLGLQYLISWLSVRFDSFDQFIKPEPALLFYEGNYVAKNMKQERVSQRELDEKMRENGFTGKSEVFAIVLETTGDLTVIGRSENERDDYSAMTLVNCGDVETNFS